MKEEACRRRQPPLPTFAACSSLLPCSLLLQASGNGATAPIDLSELTAVGPLDG